MQSSRFPSKQQAQQAFRKPAGTSRTVDRNIGNNADISVADHLHDLQEGIVVASDGFHAGPIDRRLGIARGTNGLGITQGPKACRLSFARGLSDERIRLELSNTNTLLRAHQLGLNFRQGRFPNQLLALLLGGFLNFVCLALFLRDFPISLRLHQIVRRVDVTDQGVDRLNIVRRQCGADTPL